MVRFRLRESIRINCDAEEKVPRTFSLLCLQNHNINLCAPHPWTTATATRWHDALLSAAEAYAIHRVWSGIHDALESNEVDAKVP